MKKIFSIFILAVVCALSAQATQTVTITTTNTTSTVGFRVNKVSSASTYKLSNTRYAIPLSSGSQDFSTVTEETNYWTVSGSLNGNANYAGAYSLTLSFPSDDLTYLEITSGQDQIATVDVSGAAGTLAGLSLKGCTNLTTLTLGTMSALTDLDLSTTGATIANTVTASNCPALENLNVANCGLSSLTYNGTTLYAIDVTGNSLTSLNLSACTNLDIVRCERNSSLTTLTLPASVTTISAQNSGLTSLTGFGESLAVLDAASNGLTSLKFDGFTNLTDLDVTNNHLTFRSLPGEEDKPVRMLYMGNDGIYNVYDEMRAAFGSYSYPLQSRLPSYSSRTDADFTIDMSDHVLNASDAKTVSITFENAGGTELAQAVSGDDGNDFTIDNSTDRYGFMKTQTQVRAKFTYSLYPELTLYSGYFIVPEGVAGTLKIVDEDGTTLYTKEKAFFSDATDGLPDYAKRDYTKYTIPAKPTMNGDTWTIVAGPSDDAPFAWAKTYGSAVWYYMSVGTQTNKWVTAGEQREGSSRAGYALKSSYSTSDTNYQWAFVGNQYSGFKIYNKAKGSGQTLQDKIGYWTPDSRADFYPIMRNDESLAWRVRTNSSGTGFTLENVWGGKDNDTGLSAPCVLNNYASQGYMNYWITSTYDAVNNSGSLINVVKAGDPVSGLVKWVIVDEDDNPIYSVAVDATVGSTVSEYPSSLTTLASERFVTLDDFPGSFTVASTDNVKRIGYTWTGPFKISTSTKAYHHQLLIRKKYLHAETVNSDGSINLAGSSSTGNGYRWLFYGDPFNGFKIRCYAQSEKCLDQGTSTSDGSFPTLDNVGSYWLAITPTGTPSGYEDPTPFCIRPVSAAAYLNDYSNANIMKYWQGRGSTTETGSIIQTVFLEEVVATATITWNIVDSDGNSVLKVSTDEALNTTLTEYPSEVAAYTERFVSFPALNLTIDQSKEVEVHYTWTGPFQLTTDESNPKLYQLRSAKSSWYVYIPIDAESGTKIEHKQLGSPSKRFVWFFTGNPFDGIEIHPYTEPSLRIKCSNTAQTNVGWTLTNESFKIIPRVAKDSNAEFGLVNSASTGTCLSEQGWTWLASVVGTDHGCHFAVESVDASMLLESGYYTIRNNRRHVAGSDNYLTLYPGSYDSWLSLTYPSTLSDQWILLEEQAEGTFIISRNGYYMTGIEGTYPSRAGYTTDKSEAYSAGIEFHPTAGTYRIRLTTSGSYQYLCAKDNDNQQVDNWTATDAGCAWLIDPINLTANKLDGSYWASAYMPFDYTLPEGTTAYKITAMGDDEANAEEISGIIPAGTGVVIESDSHQPHFLYDSSASAATTSGNLLSGTYTEKTTTEGDYVFSGYYDVPGFYLYDTAATLQPYKAYLPAETIGTRHLRIVFGGNVSTSINNVVRKTGTDDKVYDLQGRRVLQPQKGGVYIVNGKRVLF